MAGALPVKVKVKRQLVWGPMETLLKGAPNLGHISKIEKKTHHQLGKLCCESRSYMTASLGSDGDAT